MSDVKDELVSKVLTRFGLQQRAWQSSKEKVMVDNVPVITIAREPGSGGKPVAKKVAKKLGYTFYDEALIEAVAKSAKKRKQVIEKIDERTRSAVQDMVHNLLNPNYVSDSTYIHHLIKVVLGLATNGKAVILGRGANFIVPDTLGFHVMVTSPRDVRVKRAIKYEKINEIEARERIDKISKERKQFVSQYFSKNYANPRYYDLIINTEYFDIESTAELVIAGYKKKFARVRN